MKFENFPRPLRSALVLGLGYRNRLRRYGGEYQRFLDFLRSTDAIDPAARSAYQARALIDLLAEIQHETPALARLGLDLSAFQGDRDPASLLRTLPVQEKGEMRAQPADYVNRAAKAVVTSHTSGSTGSPMHFGHEKVGLQRRFALMKDHHRIAGLPPNGRSWRLSGRIIASPDKRVSRPWLWNPAERQVFVSTYHLNSAHELPLAQLARKYAPEVIDGYPSAIVELAEIVGDRLDSLKGVITTAETIELSIREAIKSATGAQVFDYYAASEGVPPIQQCKFGVYHVRWQGGIFEIKNEDSIDAEGNGELVSTSFVQRMTPLVRYRTGDLVEGYVLDTTCRCGLRTPTVKRIIGRVEDIVKTPDGRKIGMFAYRTLKQIDGIEASQIIQYGYDHFHVIVVLPDGIEVQASGLKDRVQGAFERALGYNIRLTLDRVDEIPKGPNGKVRSVISKVV